MDPRCEPKSKQSQLCIPNGHISSHIPLSFMSAPSNPQSQQPLDDHVKSSQTSQNGYHKVTFGEVLSHTWSSNDSSSSIINSPNLLFQIWFGQNVYPLLTPMRIFFFVLSLISSLLAFGSLTQTEFYKSSDYLYQFLFVAALVGHTLSLIFILFFGCCSVGPHHYALKSLGEVGILVLVSCLMLAIGHNHRHGSDEVAVLVTVVSMDVDAVCLISLLTPDHHSSLLEAIVTLTLHLVGLLGSSNLRIFAMFLVFLILLVKNFQWRHVGDAQNDQHHLIWDAQEAV